MKDCKKICLFTATGAENLGDELITLCEIIHFRQLFPGVQIVLFSHSVHSTKRFLISQKCSLEHLLIEPYFPENIRSHPFKNIGLFFRTVRLIASVDRVYIGGGGLLYGVSEEGHSPLRLWWFRALLARLLGRPLFYHAIGISASYDELQPFAKGLFGNAVISVRDLESQTLLTKLGYSSEIIEDPVFSYIPSELPIAQKKSKTIGIALRSGFLPDEVVTDFVRGLLQKGYDIVLLPHSLHPVDEQSHDGYYLQRFLFAGVRVTQSIEKTLEEYQRCDLIIAMRLHSIILSLNLGIPFVALSYAKKTQSILTSHHVDYYSPDDVTAEQLLSAVREKLYNL